MTKLSKQVVLFLLFCMAGLTLPFAHAQAAPKLFFDPVTISVDKNDEFEIQLKIDAESNQVIGSDVAISFADGDLDVIDVKKGDYFPQFTHAKDDGKIELHGFVTSTYQGKTGAGTLATIKFKSKKDSGSNAISFACTSGGNDTNMINDKGANILACAQLNQVAVTHTGGGNPPNTPTPTRPPGATSTPTPSPVPNRGNTVPYCTSLTSNITQANGSPVSVTFTCSGTDSGGDITAAEFVFGDGTSELVSKNVGSPGSLSTTHTYTTIGTLGASCKVRDNDNVFSYSVTACKRIVKINPKTTTTPSAGSTTGSTTTNNGATVKLSPTIAVVSIIEDTPSPTPATASATPTVYPDDSTIATDSSDRFWWIVGGAIALLLAFLLLRRRGGPPTPPPHTHAQEPWPQTPANGTSSDVPSERAI